MATYKIKGRRFLRAYKAEALTPAYAAPVDAQRIVDSMCDVPWVESSVVAGVIPAHAGNEKTDAANVASREAFDAYEFCAEHADGVHRVYAGAACYRFELPTAAIGATLKSVSASVASDPYNYAGLRVSVNTNSTGVIPTDCAVCRAGASSDLSPSAQSNNGTESAPATEWTSTNTHVEGAVPRLAVTANNNTTWYGSAGTVTIAPTGGLTLGKYLMVFVMLENYNYSRQAYIEGSGVAHFVFTLEFDEAIDGWTDGATIDLASGTNEYAVVRDGVMPELPEGRKPIRSTILMRTGDDLPVVSDEDGVLTLPDAARIYTPTAEQGAIGLRNIYARMALGKMAALPAPSLQRPGVAFTVRAATRALLAGDGSTVSVPTWRLALSALTVPFAVPTAFRASKIRLDWDSWDGSATAGAKFCVWLARDTFDEDASALLDAPEVFEAATAQAGRFALVGTIDATQAEKTATFDIAPLTGHVATLLFTAYVNMDFVNPSSESDAVYGVGNLEDDRIAGELTGLESAWRPDITLIG